MRILVTADWQAEWANLDECRKSWKHCVDIATKEKLEAIVNAGDMKRHYNPVDVRVIKFWLWAISYAKKKGLRVLFVLGNHDRVGMYSDAQNWLPILRRAGAETFDQPTTVTMRDGTLAILPFSTSTTMLRTAAKKLARSRKWNPKQDVLIFHQDLKNCKYNALGQRSEVRFSAKDLLPDNYFVCIGGHIHLHQKIGGNVYYVGSPFAMDWGEANQRKGCMVVRGSNVRWEAGVVPGWYDESWPGFPGRAAQEKEFGIGSDSAGASGSSGTVIGPEQLLQGARVRVHVNCPADQSYTRTVERARVEAERHYPGSIITVVPEFEEEENGKATIKVEDSDERKIKAYVSASNGNALGSARPRIETYLAAKLKRCGSSWRHGKGVEFVRTSARNFLCFQEVEIDYKQKGVTVVAGKNNDWAGRSNGSGKTSSLQPIAVAITGRTFKGQKFDGWARRGTKEIAEVKLWLKASNGKKVKIVRARRPGSLRLYVDGKEQSTGMRSDQKDATQGLIEQVTGFTWQTLANAVYIDPTVTHAFLAGTKKERTAILSRFQNLERFEKALELVRLDKSRLQDVLDENEHSIGVTRARIKDCKTSLARAVITAKSKLKETRKKWDVAVKVLDAAEKTTKKRKKSLEAKREEAEAKFETLNSKAAKLEPILSSLKQKIQKFEHVVSDSALVQKGKKCPTCLQKIDKDVLADSIGHFNSILKKKKHEYGRVNEEYQSLSKKAYSQEAEVDRLTLKLSSLKNELATFEREAEWWGAKYQGLKKEESSARNPVKYYTRQLATLREALARMKKGRVLFEAEMKELEYCEHAFSRDGIPAFLNAQLIPHLNKAAEEYARLFGDKYLQVRFKMVDGEFEPIILNANGGESIDDQSVGEKALAGLITSFALREVAPKCNLLIVDEPGEGLDAMNARQFAAALPKLAERFGTVVITTHNSHMLAELSGQRTITVVKKNGKSRLVA